MLSKNHELWMIIMRTNTSKMTNEDIRVILNRYSAQLDADVSQNRQSILMTAASLGNIKLVQQLLSMNADIHRQDANGRTALHYAASVGAIQIFELLIAKGAKVDAVSIGGETPLMKAALFSQVNIIEWYLNNSPESFKKVNNSGQTALQILGKMHRQLQVDVKAALDQL